MEDNRGESQQQETGASKEQRNFGRHAIAGEAQRLWTSPPRGIWRLAGSQCRRTARTSGRATWRNQEAIVVAITGAFGWASMRWDGVISDIRDEFISSCIWFEGWKIKMNSSSLMFYLRDNWCDHILINHHQWCEWWGMSSFIISLRMSLSQILWRSSLTLMIISQSNTINNWMTPSHLSSSLLIHGTKRTLKVCVHPMVYNT
jgi:hypothetical protein